MRQLLSVAGSVAICLCCTACATDQPGIEVRTVEVPVPQPCLAADEIPAEPPTVSHLLTGNAAADLAIVSASALALRAWGQELATAHRACSE
jgi:hypothetical protein